MSNINRRTALKAGMGLAVAGAFMELAKANAATKTRHVSAAGSDTNPGTAAAPWASLARIVAALESGELQRGDAVLLKRGDTFYGSVLVPPLKGTTGFLSFGAYGTGGRPRINGYKISKDAWVQHSPGVWKLSLRPGSGQYTGNTTGTSTDVGFLKVGGVIQGAKRWNRETLVNQWDFYSGATNVYVKLDSRPGAGIEIALRQNGFQVSSNNWITGLHLVGHGAHGMTSVSQSHVYIGDCLIEEIGGSQLSGTTRYGNGLEVWIGAVDNHFENNTIRQTYDVGYTMQGTAHGGNVAWTNIHFRNNRIENCGQSFEVWSEGTPAVGTGHIRCSFTDNVCVDAGRSWAADVRPDRDGMGTHLLTYNVVLPCDIELTRNQFIRARDQYARCVGGQLPAGMNTHHNIITLNPGQKIAYLNPETIEQYDSWRARTHQEQGTQFLAGV
jgi:hypothetical protein